MNHTPCVRDSLFSAFFFFLLLLFCSPAPHQEMVANKLILVDGAVFAVTGVTWFFANEHSVKHFFGVSAPSGVALQQNALLFRGLGAMSIGLSLVLFTLAERVDDVAVRRALAGVHGSLAFANAHSLTTGQAQAASFDPRKLAFAAAFHGVFAAVYVLT
eukprot:m.26569 g.26569  ORF g.26569 m.26569 type:complete len:159 (-) comp13788_c0_seq2:119-595(-)